MSNINFLYDKTSGNDGWIKETYKTFWGELKTSLMKSIDRAFYTTLLVFHNGYNEAHWEKRPW